MGSVLIWLGGAVFGYVLARWEWARRCRSAAARARALEVAARDAAWSISDRHIGGRVLPPSAPTKAPLAEVIAYHQHETERAAQRAVADELEAMAERLEGVRRG